MNLDLIRIGKGLRIYSLFSILLFTGCGAPEDYAIPPINQDIILKGTHPTNAAHLASEKQGSKTLVIEIKTMSFNPTELTVHKGDTVVWSNQDLVAHCVSEDPGKGWTSNEVQPGRSWKMVVKKSTDYYCAIHQVMKGKLIITE